MVFGSLCETCADQLLVYGDLITHLIYTPKNPHMSISYIIEMISLSGNQQKGAKLIRFKKINKMHILAPIIAVIPQIKDRKKNAPKEYVHVVVVVGIAKPNITQTNECNLEV